MMKPKVLVPMFAMACLLALPAGAQVNYAVSGGSAYVTSSPNASGDIVIASTYQGRPVTSIEALAFYFCTSLTNVTIPDSVIIIGMSAFEGCISLTSVVIPGSVADIGDYAFWNCISLTNVTLPHSVTTIGNGAFRACDSLTSVTIPNSLSAIGQAVFSHCNSLTNVTFRAASPESETRHFPTAPA